MACGMIRASPSVIVAKRSAQCLREAESPRQYRPDRETAGTDCSRGQSPEADLNVLDRPFRFAQGGCAYPPDMTLGKRRPIPRPKTDRGGRSGERQVGPAARKRATEPPVSRSNTAKGRTPGAPSVRAQAGACLLRPIRLCDPSAGSGTSPKEVPAATHDLRRRRERGVGPGLRRESSPANLPSGKPQGRGLVPGLLATGRSPDTWPNAEAGSSGGWLPRIAQYRQRAL
jgi:hypothetical protein